MQPDTAPFLEALQKLGVDASFTVSDKHCVPLDCYYFRNPDGTIRWIWPQSGRQPDFLKMYHTVGLRPMLFSLAAKLLFRFQLPGLIAHGEIRIYIDEHHEKVVRKDWNDRWALFTGTVGQARKAILWHASELCNAGTFVKVALTDQAAVALANEEKNIRYHSRNSFKHIALPVIEGSERGVLRQQGVSDQIKRVNKIHQLPIAAVREWSNYELGNSDDSFHEFANVMQSRMSLLGEIKDDRIPSQFYDKLARLYKAFQGQRFPTAASHGDFTPWNVFVTGHRLSIIDWELGQSGMPALFDLFHFCFQNNILVARNGYSEIKKELHHFFDTDEWKEFCRRNAIDLRVCERAYVLFTSSYFLHQYSQQPVWHTQVNWLFNTWSDALSFHLWESGKQSAREILLQDLSQLLKDKKYALLKWNNEALNTLSEFSDLDICMDKRSARIFTQGIRQHPLVQAAQVKSFSYMRQLRLILVDGSLLHIDLVLQFKRRSTLFLDAKEVMSSCETNEHGIKIASRLHNRQYLERFFLLNNSQVPSKFNASFGPFRQNRSEILRDIGTTIRSNFWHRLKDGVLYAIDSLTHLLPRKGIVVTFSGVDGAGKSTVIENLRHGIEKGMRQKVVVLRHRPSLLPILSAFRYGKKQAEKRAAHTLPRQGKNKSSYSSLLRFGYYFIDYFFGQFFVQARYVWRGYIVLYDRYYFDFINDSRRSNIQLSPQFTAWWYRLLVKPKLNFFLYADPQTIVKRKQELDADTIQVLTRHYLTLFNKLGARSERTYYIPIENKDLPLTMDIIFKHVKKEAL